MKFKVRSTVIRPTIPLIGLCALLILIGQKYLGLGDPFTHAPKEQLARYRCLVKLHVNEQGDQTATVLNLQKNSTRSFNKIEWLHMPKAGTSFGNLLLLWACPELDPALWVTNRGVSSQVPGQCLEKFRRYPWKSRKRWPIGEHWTLQGRAEEELGDIFTTVRNPRTRLASGFHHTTKYTRLGATQHDICNHAKLERRSHSTLGAQVKIISGRYKYEMCKDQMFCFASPKPPSLEDAQLACQRLQRFAFVGITDYWDATVCLFHAEFGGTMHDMELANVRQGKQVDRNQALEYVNCNDDKDEYLFNCAMERFLERMQRHPHCIKYMH